MNSDMIASSIMLGLLTILMYFKNDIRIMWFSILIATILFIWGLFDKTCDKCPKCNSCLSNSNVWKLHNYGRCRCQDCDMLIESIL